MRKYRSGLFVAAVLAASATLGAQAQGQSPASVPPADANTSPGVQQAPRAPAAQVRTQNTVNISGCLENAPAAAAAAGRDSTAGFVLANAEMTASGRPAPGGAVGTAGSSTTSYRLEGDEKLISPHLNHQVRITGTLQSSAASAVGAEKSAAGSTASGGTLKVESVEMVAATCAAANKPAASPRSADPAPAQPAQPARPAEPARPDPAKPAAPDVPPDRN